MDNIEEITLLGTAVPFTIMNVFLVVLFIIIKNYELEFHMTMTLSLLWTSLLFYFVCGLYAQLTIYTRQTNGFLLFLWRLSEVIEKSAIMIDIARMELNLRLRNVANELDTSILETKMKTWLKINLISLWVLYLTFEVIEDIAYGGAHAGETFDSLHVIEIILVLYSDFGFILWYLAIILRMAFNRRRDIYIIKNLESQNFQIASGDLSNQMKKKRIAALVVLTASIAPNYIFRGVIVLQSLQRYYRWNQQLELLFGLTKCLMIFGFCVAILWRFLQATSIQRDQESKSILKLDSVIGINASAWKQQAKALEILTDSSKDDDAADWTAYNYQASTEIMITLPSDSQMDKPSVKYSLNME